MLFPALNLTATVSGTPKAAFTLLMSASVYATSDGPAIIPISTFLCTTDAVKGATSAVSPWFRRAEAMFASAVRIWAAADSICARAAST